MTLTVGSLFSGIGGFDLGFENAGMKVLWQVEVEEACVRVLRRQWPEVQELGDITEVKGSRLPAVDVLCGGFPCQDLSVAGARRGLAGERSGLFFEFTRLVAELRPRWLVIENVPGLLSSFSSDNPPPGDLAEGLDWQANETSDLGIVLSTLGELGYWWAYRTLDAQYHGVAQRRERVFIVGHSRAGRATQVLFEPGSCDWNSAPSRSAREGATAEPSERPVGTRRSIAAESTLDLAGPIAGGDNGVGRRSELDPNLVIAATLRSRQHSPGINVPGRGGEDDQNLVIAHAVTSHQAKGGDPTTDGYVVVPEVAGTLMSPDGGSRGTDLDGKGAYVVEEDSFAFESRVARNGRGAPEDVVPPLKAQSGRTGKGDSAPMVSYGIRSDAPRDGKAKTPSPDADGKVRLRDPGFNISEELAPTMDAGQAHIVAHTLRAEGADASEDGTGRGTPLTVVGVSFNQRREGRERDAHGSLNSKGRSNTQFDGVRVGAAVRRLMPIECERLQGFPDGWTESGIDDCVNGRVSWICEGVVGLPDVIGRSWTERVESVLCTISDSRSTGVQSYPSESESHAAAHRVAVAQSKRVATVSVATSHGSDTEILVSLSGGEPNEPQEPRAIGTDEMAATNTGVSLSMCLEEDSSPERLSTILTWIRGTTLLPTLLSLLPEPITIALTIHWNSSRPNSSDEASLRLKMGRIEPVSDSARYRMLGNAVCAPVAEWIGRRIIEVDDDGQTADGQSTLHT